MSLEAESHLVVFVMMVWGDINAHETLAIGPKEKGKILVYQSASDPNTVDISSTKSLFLVRVADTAQYTTIQDIVRRVAQDYSSIQISEDNIDWLKKDGLKVVHILASTHDLSPGLRSGLPSHIGSISSRSSLPSGSYSGIRSESSLRHNTATIVSAPLTIQEESEEE
ncbi:hypothetical protein CVT25_004111 [Psilocybe cyanescens]|uniref:Uncharacterized protein n=1 Tax=Psilocybe cyanescens TaxID=93625 RepID=A0A409X319_PSICY|nr:hypothetical protein CVT25_004111 [Psilocybe cyanescens]